LREVEKNFEKETSELAKNLKNQKIADWKNECEKVKEISPDTILSLNVGGEYFT